jgi:hypothetical protein
MPLSTQFFVGRSPFELSKVEAIRNAPARTLPDGDFYRHDEPFGGLWTTSELRRDDPTNVCHWLLDAGELGFYKRGEKLYIAELLPEPAANVLILNSMDDVVRFAIKHVTKRSKAMSMTDWENIPYDAVYLTMDAHESVLNHEFDSDLPNGPFIHWGPECTLWLKPRFTLVSQSEIVFPG